MIDNQHILEAWGEEAERRIEKLETGEMKETPLEEALASLKRKLKQCLNDEEHPR